MTLHHAPRVAGKGVDAVTARVSLAAAAMRASCLCHEEDLSVYAKRGEVVANLRDSVLVLNEGASFCKKKKVMKMREQEERVDICALFWPGGSQLQLPSGYRPTPSQAHSRFVCDDPFAFGPAYVVPYSSVTATAI